jgi:F420-dependent oxidoreductase-like protein
VLASGLQPRPTMRLGLDVSQHQLTWPELLDRTRLAEDAGFDGAWVFDHFRPLYGDPNGPCYEGWTLMAALAAATRRIRIGNLVTGVTYRPPQLLAMEAVTIDHVSNGRLEIGIGAAWNEREHRSFGWEFPRVGERVSRLEEAIQVMKLLMTTEGASFDGRYYHLTDATYSPRPIQQPHPPIWVGGAGDRVLGITARHADAWHANTRLSAIPGKLRILDEAAEAAGRDPREILRAGSLSLSQSMDGVRRDVERLRELGFGYLVVSWPSEGQERLEEFIEQVMPEVMGDWPPGAGS